MNESNIFFDVKPDGINWVPSQFPQAILQDGAIAEINLKTEIDSQIIDYVLPT